MLVADDVDELESLQQRYKATRFDRKGLGLTLVTSLGCNFDCPYCFEAKQPSVMSDRVQAAVLRLVDEELPKISRLTVTWFGGEPLVGKKALIRLSKAFIERCDRTNVAYEASIITNGYLLDEETCEKLHNARIAVAQVTIDGPPAVHDRMRPLVNGAGTFWQIVKNLRHAINYLTVSVRVNLDVENFHHANILLQILASEGLGGKVGVYAGQIVTTNHDTHSVPSNSYKPTCFTNPEFARVEREFNAMAKQYGFGDFVLPKPTGAPCTAVRANELVIGSRGELYKCWESVGNPREVIGHVDDYENADTRTGKWLKYDPFTNVECRSCMALPVCMGGCAQHAMDPLQYENRCGTFRHNFRERVLDFVAQAEQEGLRGIVRTQDLARRMETR